MTEVRKASPGSDPEYIEQKTQVLQADLAEAKRLLAADGRRAAWYRIGGVAAISLGLMSWMPNIKILFFLNDPSHILVTWLLVCVGLYFVVRPRSGYLLFRVQDVHDQMDALRYVNDGFDLRAERQFKQHQAELKRYYDQALQQSQWVFILGVACIVAGIGLVLYCVYLVTHEAGDTQGKLIIGALGAVGSILINYVAAMYLKMHSSVVQSLTEFHNRLVHTHHLYFGYFLASKIPDSVKRKEAGMMNEIISELALATRYYLLGDKATPASSDGHKPKVKVSKKKASAKPTE